MVLYIVTLQYVKYTLRGLPEAFLALRMIETQSSRRHCGLLRGLDAMAVDLIGT